MGDRRIIDWTCHSHQVCMIIQCDDDDDDVHTILFVNDHYEYLYHYNNYQLGERACFEFTILRKCADSIQVST